MSVNGGDRAGVIEGGGGRNARGGHGVEVEPRLGQHGAVVGEEVSVARLKELAVGDGRGEQIEIDNAIIDDDVGINVGAGGEHDVVDVRRLAGRRPAAQGQNQQQGQVNWFHKCAFKPSLWGIVSGGGRLPWRGRSGALDRGRGPAAGCCSTAGCAHRPASCARGGR